MDNWFLEQLDKHGWITIEKQTPNVHWIKDIWKVGSAWSPRNCEIYLVFEVDPQDDPEDPGHTTWVHALIERPLNWLSNDDESPADKRRSGSIASMTLGRNREKYISEFFEELNRLRLNQV